MILTIRTDKPEAEIGLYDGNEQLAYYTWHAHRELAETIHIKIRGLLEERGKDWADISGIIVFAGPGSFTGLRIGISVANALAYANNVPVAGTGGEQWIADGAAKLQMTKAGAVVLPEYGSDVHITPPRK